MHFRQMGLLPTTLFFLLCSVGCGKKDGPELVPVSGRIMMDKRPLAKAILHFQPVRREGGAVLPDSYGETDEQGYYVLKPAVAGRSDLEGAVVGKHVVTISLFDRNNPGPSGPVERVPAKYNTDSKLTFVVPPAGAKDKANFLDLTSR
jgi:hypothetical protein